VYKGAETPMEIKFPVTIGEIIPVLLNK